MANQIKDHSKGAWAMMNNLGGIQWSQQNWERVNRAVYLECMRTEIASKFLPICGPMPDALTIPSDTTEYSKQVSALKVDEAAVVPLIEIWVEFKLTPQQVETEMDLGAAETLAIYAARFLAAGQDTLIFQGEEATRTNPLFTSKRVQFRSGPAGTGLFGAKLPKNQILTIPSLVPGKAVFRERTLAAVTKGISILQEKGQYGPYVLILEDGVFGDAHVSLPNTLIAASDRIKLLTDSGFFGTGTLPDEPAKGGLLLSLGGNTMDLVVGFDSNTAFLQEDEAGLYRFRVTKRFALRLKDDGAVIKLLFQV